MQQEWWKKNEDGRDEGEDHRKELDPAEADLKKDPSTERKKATLMRNETFYDTIYHIKIEEPTLRELLILQSLYVC